VRGGKCMSAKTIYPRLSTLLGLLTKYNIKQENFAKSIGRAPSTVSKNLNGRGLFNANDLKNIQKFVNQKEISYAKSKGIEPHHYSVDEIFFS
jgi:transcriptional regulator with XRE-family HTH domain